MLGRGGAIGDRPVDIDGWSVAEVVGQTVAVTDCRVESVAES